MEVIHNNNFEYVILIGASTGGKDTVCKLLKEIPKNFSPILIAQHMPPDYTASYVRYLKKMTGHDVIESRDGDELARGRVIVATGEHQMRLVNGKRGLYVSCIEEGAYKGNCPSIDILFNSAAKILKEKAIGVLLTGKGNDGAVGLLEIKNNNALTIVQDENSSVAYEMPKAAYELGAADKIIDLKNIPREIISYIGKNEFNIQKKYFYYKNEVSKQFAEYV